MNNLTVVYYTSNKEDEAFEQKIRNRLLLTMGDLPLISVSQKPIDFGTNICVGNVGVSARNAIRQLQIGALEAKTKFIVSAEADCLYPPEYFTFIPPMTNRPYRYDNVWIARKHLKRKFQFKRKSQSECAQVCARERLIKSIDKWLRDRDKWNPYVKNDPKPSRVLFRKKWKFFHGEIPVISIKTGRGMNAGTSYIKKDGKDLSKMKLPYWGSIDLLKKEFFG